MNVEGRRERGRPKKRLLNVIKGNMRIAGKSVDDVRLCRVEVNNLRGRLQIVRIKMRVEIDKGQTYILR